MSTRKLARKEAKTLKHMKARKTVNSGATHQDGDGRRLFKKPIGFQSWRALFIEHKATEASSFSVKWNTLQKARIQAHANNDLPALVVELPVDKYVVLRYDDFIDLLDYLEYMQS